MPPQVLNYAAIRYLRERCAGYTSAAMLKRFRKAIYMIAGDLSGMHCVVPGDVKEASRPEHKLMLDIMILGLMVSRAWSEDI